MALDEDEVEKILKDLVKEAGLTLTIAAVVYREDYQDYLTVIGDVHYTDLREKLINDYITTKHIDFKNEIIFKLKNPYELEEWQKEDWGIKASQQQENKDKIELDTKEDNDWV